jgi:2-polyprenyl-3-methyl-5-hydroxy-6-metoxy-1,4-benzoquinol methylase
MGLSGKDFSAIAASWDEKPQRVHLATAVASAIQEQIPLDDAMKALEFGCGTGLVSFHLIDQLRHVTAMDSARGMLDVLQQKAEAIGVANMKTQLNDSAVPTLDPESFDLIYSSMVLHHIKLIKPVIAQLIAALKPGGFLALADLDAEDGCFHDRPEGVEHHGIDRDELCQLLEHGGLQQLGRCTAHTITKHKNNREQNYPVFLVWGRKPL